MPVSEKKKASNAKWDKENMVVLSCKVRKEKADAFKAYAAQQGKTGNTLLKEYVMQCIGEEGGHTPAGKVDSISSNVLSDKDDETAALLAAFRNKASEVTQK